MDGVLTLNPHLNCWKKYNILLKFRAESLTWNKIIENFVEKYNMIEVDYLFESK